MVLGDRIAAVGRHDGPAREVLDARGMLVTPGFVDVHTHLDAQLTWDPSGDPVCWHGITSVVVGNCGVGFAPCRPADRDYLMFLMEGVEDVPRAAMAAGMRWAWEGFGDYLTALERSPLGLNVGAYVAHAPLRVWAMGERGALPDPPSDGEREAMRRAVDEALAAGGPRRVERPHDDAPHARGRRRPRDLRRPRRAVGARRAAGAARHRRRAGRAGRHRRGPAATSPPW